jgi:hypothetical protein
VSIRFRLFSNGGTGGAVDYSAPLADVATLTWATPPLTAPGDWTFGIRPYDDATGLEDLTGAAEVRVVIDASGADITARPNAPFHVQARATAAAGLLVEWAYSPVGQGGPPTGFRVWATAGVSVNYAAAPNATVAYTDRTRYFAAPLAGLTAATAYAVGVRAYNAAGAETNTAAVASATTDAAGPPPPVLASASAGTGSSGPVGSGPTPP